MSLSIGDGIAIAGIMLSIAIVSAVSVKVYIRFPSDFDINHFYKAKGANDE